MNYKIIMSSWALFGITQNSKELYGIAMNSQECLGSPMDLVRIRVAALENPSKILVRILVRILVSRFVPLKPGRGSKFDPYS